MVKQVKSKEEFNTELSNAGDKLVRPRAWSKDDRT
jgi:hypothetical protein